MNNRFRYPAWLIMASAVAPFVAGQVVTEAPPAANPPEDTILLSPFMVSSERDTGYQAQSTLAGNRLNTPIKDIGASITVFTKDFLDDIGATNTNQLLIYAPNMEAAGPGGNVSAIDANNTAEGVRNSPQETARTRGLGAPSFTRGYVQSSIPSDGYNVQSVTVNRGPNAILFGIGSPAGVVDSTLLQANLNRNTNRVVARYGNNDSLRAILDINRVLIDGKLGLRVSALDTNERYNQRPAFEKQTRLYGALVAQPFRSTTLRGNFETGKIRSNRPITIVPLMGYTQQWMDAGMPTFDWTFYDDPARNPNAVAQQAQNNQPILLGQGQIFGQTVTPYPTTTSIMPSPSFDSTIVSTTGTALNAIRSNIVNPVFNRDGAPDSINYIETRALIELPATFFPGGRAPAGMRPQGFTDSSMFDWRNRMLDETSRQADDFRAFNLSLQQLAWEDRLGIELNYTNEVFTRFTKNSFFSQQSSSLIRIDPNVTLPTGEPNPNLGRPYATFGQSNWNHLDQERESLRATAFARFDFKDVSPNLGRWLGRHTLTGLAERYSLNNVGWQTRLLTSGVQATNISPLITSFVRGPYVQVYLGDSVLDGSPLSFSPIQIPEMQPGNYGQVAYFAAPLGSTAQGNFVTVPHDMIRIAGRNHQAFREVIESQAAVLQSYWADDLLVTTVGWREDKSYREVKVFGIDQNPTKWEYSQADFDFASTPPAGPSGDVWSYSAVLRWPQKLVRLPRGTDASIFYNKSENFTPAGARRDPFDNPLSPPQGETEEIGANLWLFDEKLSLRIARFKTTVTNASLNGHSGTAGPLGTMLNNIIGQGVVAFATEQNLNPGLDRSADIAALVQGFPSDYLARRGFAVTGTVAEQNLTATILNIPGVQDTTDFEATGTELELVYNPTRGLRILANVAQQETVQTNVAPFTRDVWARLQPAIAALGEKPRLRYPAGWVEGTPHNTQTLNDYIATNMSAALGTVLGSEGRVSAEQARWRANLVANYTFARGTRLEGWGIGSGVRWQDKTAIGYPTSYDAVGATVLDFDNPYYAKALTNVDAWLSYSRRIWDGRVNWKAQFNVQNLVAERDLIPFAMQGWGEVAQVRTPPERRFYLTNTFEF